MAIRFYRINEPYGEFSNFWRQEFELDGAPWPTTEHYFQAQKFAGTGHVETVRLAPTPRDAARIGRDRGLPLRPDWEEVKEDVMRRALRAKFAQNEPLKQLLLSTGDEELIETTTDDTYWGCGTEGHGQNRLGVLLMELRKILKPA
ncbi:MAG: NADAR family protein [Candidatus Sumerlaeia bacterium]